MSRPREGALAPDFTLDGTDGPFTLGEHRGTPVVLIFYPGDETPVCTRQMCSYRDRSDELEGLRAVVVGISGGDVGSKARFAANHGLTVPLLADGDGAVAGAYGVKGPLGPKRATFVIDEEGVIRAAKVHRFGLTYASVDEIADLLAGTRA